MENRYKLADDYTGPWSLGLGRYTLPVFKLNAVRITLIYLALGMGALVVSDYLLVGPLADPVLAQVQALKGTVEVVLTAGLIFVLTRTHEWQFNQASSKMKTQRDELGVLHRVVRHNLRNDVNVIYGMVDRLIGEKPSTETTRHRKTIFDRLDGLEDNIDHLRRIREVTSGELTYVTVELSGAIATVLETHPDITEEVEVSVAVPDDITIKCNHMLQEGVRELLRNAIRHNSADTPAIDIKVDPESASAGMVRVHITDNGPGMPPLELEAIQARRGERESQVLHSDGLGLWFVDWMVTHSGGELLVDEGEAGGTRITLCLPTA